MKSTTILRSLASILATQSNLVGDEERDEHAHDHDGNSSDHYLPPLGMMVKGSVENRGTR